MDSIIEALFLYIIPANIILGLAILMTGWALRIIRLRKRKGGNHEH